MRVLFLTQTGRIGASARYRVFQYLPHLEKNDVDCVVVPAVDDPLAARYVADPKGTKLRYYTSIVWRRLRDLVRLRDFDVVFLQRDFLVHSFPVLELIMSVMHPRLVLDVDDAIHLLPAGKRPRALFRMLHDPRKTERMARRSAHLIAGNEVIADHLRGHAPALTVIPTSIDLSSYPIRAQPQIAASHLPVIGWIGSPGTAHYLKTILPALDRLASKGRRFILRTVGGSVPGTGRFSSESRPWCLDEEVADVCSFDIGIMPLTDDAWSRSKSGTKLLQYLAAQVPAVASPVGVNASILRGGVGGALASTTDEWEHSLDVLLRSPEERFRLGTEGRARVEAEFSVERSAPKLLAVLRTVGGR
jgi:glycosyltransferase involved in cell wall biosynthesis